MVRILGTKGSRRRRRYQLGAIVSIVAVLGLVVAQPAFAVHDLQMQLDGDVSASTPTNVGGHTQTVDWDSIFDSAGAKKDPQPADFTAATFKNDFNNSGTTFLTNDQTTFATGSKDTLPITPGWQCNFDANVNSKIDIMNGYAAAYTDPATDHDILYFALERNINTGDANVGFWFLQDEVGCSSTGGSEPFTGDHSDGDLLIVSAFTKGGTVSTIDVYRWNGGATGSLGTTAVAHGADCKTTAGGDTACATVNSGTISTPWLTANKQDGVGHSLRISEFFEGGLDLTAANLAGKCFNTFMADTRSSQSLTATLFDYSLGVLGECQSFIVTTPSISSEPIPAHGTLDVTDSADITVTGADTFSGTVTFSLCRSSELDSNGECSTGGTQIGSPQSVTANGTFVSDAAGLTAADHYCWRADFSGDTNAGVPPKSDHSTNECFDVTPLQPTLTTDATDGPVDFGDPISDTISLTGTADTPGSDGDGPGGTINATDRQPADGTISFTAFGPGDCTTVAHSGTITVSGDNTAYGGAGSVTEFTPTAPGVYTYVASYTGDLPNTLGVPATACPDPSGAEEVTVQQIPTDIMTKQSWFPQDTATVSATAGNLGADGTVTFELFDNATCDGTALYEETVDITGGSPSEEVSTSNTSYEITTGYNDAADSTVGRHSWRVTYTPNASDTAHTGARSTCDSEHFNITYTNDPGPGTDLP
jgi:hypothetical protein